MKKIIISERHQHAIDYISRTATNAEERNRKNWIFITTVADAHRGTMGRNLADMEVIVVSIPRDFDEISEILKSRGSRGMLDRR